jgi:hypothetical protein
VGGGSKSCPLPLEADVPPYLVEVRFGPEVDMLRFIRRGFLRDTDVTEWLRRDIAMNAAYAHSAENRAVSYGFAFTNFDGVDGTFK